MSMNKNKKVELGNFLYEHKGLKDDVDSIDWITLINSLKNCNSQNNIHIEQNTNDEKDLLNNPSDKSIKLQSIINNNEHESIINKNLVENNNIKLENNNKPTVKKSKKSKNIIETYNAPSNYVELST